MPSQKIKKVFLWHQDFPYRFCLIWREPNIHQKPIEHRVRELYSWHILTRISGLCPVYWERLSPYCFGKISKLLSILRDQDDVSAVF